jgi:hypothetical protein
MEGAPNRALWQVEGGGNLMEGTDGVPPEEAIGQMATGYWISQVLRTMAVFGLADHLAAGARTTEELGEQSGAHAPSLDRLLRALSALGLCVRDDEGRVRLTQLGERLRSDVPDSMKSSVLMLTAPSFQRTWEKLPDAVRRGEPTFARVHGVSFWDYLAAHLEEGALFDAVMTEDAQERAEALLAACDLSGVDTIVDVGGGQGKLLAAVLAAVPGVRGILADRPEVVAGAEEVLRAAEVADRCTVVGGDFFTSVPSGGDAYVLAQIVHDWPEEEALEILRTCHQAMAPGARLWLIEQVIESDEVSVDLALFDLNMLVFFGGQERTAEEYQELLEAAGFGEITVFPTDTDWSVVEGVRP